MTNQPKRTVFSVAHLSLTLGILAWAFAQYEFVARELAAMEAQIATLAAKVDAEQKTEDARHRALTETIEQMSKRIDIHRDDLRALQGQINAHIENGNRR